MFLNQEMNFTKILNINIYRKMEPYYYLHRLMVEQGNKIKI